MGFDVQVLSRLPLATAVLSLLRWVTQAEPLENIYEGADRGRCHTRVLKFSVLVGIIWECLLQAEGSARAGLLKVEDEQRLPVSLKAFYSKLGKMPLSVTMDFFRDSAARLRAALPTHNSKLPQSLAEFSVQLIDGKVVKHVHRRLLELRHNRVTASKLLGGRALVAVDLASGLVHDLHADPDGEANDVKFVPQLLDNLTAGATLPLLMVGDRAFGVFQICQDVLTRGGQFLFRQHGQTRFEADPQRPAVVSCDRFGRQVTEEWGWILRGKATKTRPCERIPVRRITVRRDKENLRLITSLLDAAAYPAGDLLDVYLDRWQVEQVFQKITKVFRLNALFSTQPAGTVFQLAFCLLVYNVIHIVKQSIAHHQQRDERTISTEMLFRDVRDELTAATRLIPEHRIADAVPLLPTAEHLRDHLDRLLSGCWCNRWIKANYRPRDPSKPIAPKPKKIHQKKGHDSVHRILQRSRQ